MFKKFISLKVKNDWSGDSLVVERLRLYAPNAGGLGSIPGQGTKSHIPQLRPGAAPTSTEKWLQWEEKKKKKLKWPTERDWGVSNSKGLKNSTPLDELGFPSVICLSRIGFLVTASKFQASVLRLDIHYFCGWH